MSSINKNTKQIDERPAFNYYVYAVQTKFRLLRQNMWIVFRMMYYVTSDTYKNVERDINIINNDVGIKVYWREISFQPKKNVITDKNRNYVYFDGLVNDNIVNNLYKDKNFMKRDINIEKMKSVVVDL